MSGKPPLAADHAFPSGEVPPTDEKANQAFLDKLFDTDGKPDSEAHAVTETEGLDDDDQDQQ